MKTLCAAVFIVLAAILAAFHVLPLLGWDKALVGTIASSLVAGFPKIREELDKQLAARTHPQGLSVLSLSGFGLPLPRLVLYGSLILFATMNLSSVVAGITLTALAAAPEKLPNSIAVISFLIVMPAMFLLGRWVGRRSIAQGLVAIFLIALLARMGVTVFDFAVLTGGDRLGSLSGDALLASLYGEGFTVALTSAIGVAVFFALGAVGYWRGRRQRLGSYLGYLLKNVPSATQHLIVDLAFEEAARVAKSKARVSPSNAAVEVKAPQAKAA
jgi:hypothetical protein